MRKPWVSVQRAHGFFFFVNRTLKIFFLSIALCLASFSTALGLEEITITAGGDTMIGRYMSADLRVHGGADPFEEIGELLSSADFTIVNVETPITEHVPLRIRRGRNLKRHSVIFRMPPPYADLMKRHGVDMAVLANNHAEDCGREGAKETVEVLERVGIEHVGVSSKGDPLQNRRVKVGNTHVNVLALTMYRNAGRPRPGQKVPVAYQSYDEMKVWMPKRIAEIRKEHPEDIVVASLHWGRQYSVSPSRGQVRLAHDLVDAGADLVLGHHPHVLQPVEAYKGGLILYSMGNLVFDQLRADARKSALFQIRLRSDGSGRFRPQGLSLVPIQLRRVSKGPRPATPREARETLERVKEDSRKRFRTSLRLEGNRLNWSP